MQPSARLSRHSQAATASQVLRRRSVTCRAEDEETRKTELRNFESARNDADDEVFTLPGYTVELDKIPEAERTEEQRLEAEDLRLDELEDQDAKKIAQEITAAADVEKATSLVDELAQRNQFEVELEEEVAVMREEEAQTLEGKLKALYDQGPPPGMSQEQFDAEYKMALATMEDPEHQKKMLAAQSRVQEPEFEEQIRQMGSMMNNPALMSRMQELQDDPDMEEFFRDVRKGGMAAMAPYMVNQEFLVKLAKKLEGIDLQRVMPGTVGMEDNQKQDIPDIENLMQAAKYGDVEATEDFIAIGHDVNAPDAEGRTPLHYAVAYRHMEVAQNLLNASCNLEATDSKGNTPLHYAAGYGRGDFVRKLVDAGANGKALNDSNHTPLVLVTMEPRNPLNNEADIVQLLKAAAGEE
eukprot:CAMPEP_0206135758 /NCGR_PEP_ID=MMETSP1473-20131121/1028_1 /ASSEMBLY_ACC=CAM_ASM_001109 /TAXON_ID=1461547 /ORGANISM="Stichococcus sp, Strain RCC1054" /LENGTH=410 /DNA_ID=CAMNT_0053527835 /DNA_START=228 /DNA_END=1461 /DNA_ORIENTATION=+